MSRPHRVSRQALEPLRRHRPQLGRPGTQVLLAAEPRLTDVLLDAIGIVKETRSLLHPIPSTLGAHLRAVDPRPTFRPRLRQRLLTDRALSRHAFSLSIGR